MARVLIADDEDSMRLLVARAIAMDGHEIVTAQDGDAGVLDDVKRLPQAKLVETVVARSAGFVSDVSAMEVALAALRLGAGRAKADDVIDPAVGIAELVKIGERVTAGGGLARVHANDADALHAARTMLEKAIVIRDQWKVDRCILCLVNVCNLSFM